MPLEPGHPTIEPVIALGALTIARTHEQTVFELPHALPGNTQILHPEVPLAGNETNVTFTVGTVVSKGLGFPLKRTPACALVQR